MALVGADHQVIFSSELLQRLDVTNRVKGLRPSAQRRSEIIGGEVHSKAFGAGVNLHARDGRAETNRKTAPDCDVKKLAASQIRVI